MATDPVCNMEVDEKQAKYKSRFGGKEYYFCSKECKDDFDDKPQLYTVGAEEIKE
ncbi:MAG: YHS domain-containing protein [Syntrophales bacterium]